MCSKENIAYYDCPTSEINKSLSEKKVAFDNNPTQATCQAYLNVVGHLTEPQSYNISSYRIIVFGYLSNKNESYRIKLRFK